LRILGIILIVLSLLLLIAVPPAGVICLLFGIILIIRSSKNLTDKIKASIAKSKEKSEQSAKLLKEKYEESLQEQKELKNQISDVKTIHKLKVLAQENRERMESAGLSMYEWSTAQDERVRPSHALMEGKICKWDDPTVYSTDGKTWKPRPEGAPLVHPGEEEGCRCTALSYWNELVGEVDKAI